MQLYKKLRLLPLFLVFAFVSNAYALGVEDVNKGQNDRSAAKTGAIAAGECPSEGSASVDLDVNNVRAALYNNGNLFYASTDMYEVPKGSNQKAIFASGIWIGGMVDGQLRMAAATYSNFEWRPGPLFDDGTPAANCDDYDRLWKVSKTDLEALDAGESPSRDLAEWPTGLGAPTLDANGERVVPTSRDQVIDLAAGQRPEILGDQTVWWVMNDVAAPHNETATQPIGLEAQVTAFAFNQAGALGNTTFYRYRFTYKGDSPLTNTWLGVWSDPDLGGAGDGYVGSDTTLGLGITYNASPTDGTYGDRPPAIGYDFFQGPLVEAPGETWVDPDGTVHETATRLGMQKFIYYNNDGTEQGNPGNAEEYFGYLTGFWRDGVPVTFGGTGRGFSNTPADFMYPANPPNFWSEFNFDDQGNAIAPGDRRFLQSTGPFTMNPGDVQEIVFGIVWSQDTEAASDPHLASLAKLKRDNALAQRVFDINFALPAPPDAPRVNVSELDERVILTWDYAPSSNNYLGRYQAVNPLISDVDDLTYDFEGFILYRFDSASDQEGEVVAVYDRANGITRILEETPEGLIRVDVDGTDSGLQWSAEFSNLTNYQEYHYGVQAYAYNEFSSPRTYRSPIRRVTVTPSRVGPREGGSIVDVGNVGARPDTVIVDQAGQGSVNVRVVDPSAVTGHTYRVEFYSHDVSDGEGNSRTLTVYDVVDVTDDRVLFSGSNYVQQTCIFEGAFDLSACAAPPQTENVFVADGLSFDIVGPEGALDRVVAIGPDGAIAGELAPAFALNPGATRPPTWFLSSANTVADPATRIPDYDWQGNIGARAPIDIEIRWVDNPEENGQLVFSYTWVPSQPADSAYLHGWTTGVLDEEGALQEVEHRTTSMRMPFTAWEIDQNGNERQVMAAIYDDDGDALWDVNPAFEDQTLGNSFGAWERIYLSAAEYDEELALNDPAQAYDVNFWSEPLTVGRFLLVPFGDSVGVPMAGTAIRFVSTKPNLPGDTFTFSVEDYAPQRGNEEVAEASLDDIGIVPNPYKGASAYEVSQILDEVRITNLPEQATIRVFSLSGSLVRTIEKSGPETFISWDLQTENGLPIASGMYLVHVETEIGERVIKFGVVKKTVQLNEL